MMSYISRLQWKFYLIAPLVITVIISGLWLSLSAALENIRFARANSQILGIVSTARETNIPTSEDPRKATISLIKRLSQVEVINTYSDDENYKLPVNPWGERIEIQIFPQDRAIWLSTKLSPVICRRMIMFYEKNIFFLGLRKIETKEDDKITGRTTLVYDVRKTGAYDNISPEMTEASCGRDKSIKLALTFGLQ